MRELTGAEAVFGFMGWLTTRKKVSGPFGRAINVGDAPALCGEFCEANGLVIKDSRWARNLKHPGWDYKWAGPDK